MTDDDRALGMLTELVGSQKTMGDKVDKMGEKVDKMNISMFGMETTSAAQGDKLEQISSSLFTGPDAIKSKVDGHEREIENLKAPKRSLSPIPMRSTDPKTIAGLIGVIMAMVGLAGIIAKWH